MYIWSGEQGLTLCKSLRIVSFRCSHKRPGLGFLNPTPHTPPTGKDVQPGAGIELHHVTQTIRKKKDWETPLAWRKCQGGLLTAYGLRL